MLSKLRNANPVLKLASFSGGSSQIIVGHLNDSLASKKLLKRVVMTKGSQSHHFVLSESLMFALLFSTKLRLRLPDPRHRKVTRLNKFVT